jgi:hypothetical protein
MGLAPSKQQGNRRWFETIERRSLCARSLTLMTRERLSVPLILTEVAPKYWTTRPRGIC